MDPIEGLSMPASSVLEQLLISSLEPPIMPESPVMEHFFMPESPVIEQFFMPETAPIDPASLLQPPLTAFGLPATDLSELFLSHSIHIETEPVVFDFAQDWIDAPPLLHSDPTVPSIAVEIPPLNQVDTARELIGLFQDTEPLRDKRKLKDKYIDSWWKNSKGICQVAGCNTKMQSKGKCIRHGVAARRRCDGASVMVGAHVARLKAATQVVKVEDCAEPTEVANCAPPLGARKVLSAKANARPTLRRNAMSMIVQVSPDTEACAANTKDKAPAACSAIKPSQ
ncbi:hypothetical protein PsorP6_008952 [Peronosclerospora sorghi]|uniref:Uncharacterized protein n=1 Tax=Peronosclerospora sorghi TaxID=230839 RepID=A0ACC0W125_9STRA|nr:hypothetical protein PsorP6_008952 [Peronosclerospora sorghi]